MFDTAVGRCALAWARHRLRAAVQLPEEDDGGPRWRGCCAPAASLSCSDPPPDAAAAIKGAYRRCCRGISWTLREVVLDMTQVSDFHQRVYAITRAIPPGQVRTYGDIAEQLGSKGLARAVGQALGLNPFAPVVPCHRVLGRVPGGRLPPPAARLPSCACCRSKGLAGATPKALPWFLKVPRQARSKKKPDGRKAHRAFNILERVKGIEPSYEASGKLPFYH